MSDWPEWLLWLVPYAVMLPLMFGIVDYGHRATPDVFLSAAYATGSMRPRPDTASRTLLPPR